MNEVASPTCAPVVDINDVIVILQLVTEKNN